MREIKRHFVTLYKGVVTENGVGDDVISSVTPFKGRMVHSAKQIKNALGEKVISQAQVQTFEPLELGVFIWQENPDPDNDIHAAQEVLMIDSATPLSGGVALYEAYL